MGVKRENGYSASVEGFLVVGSSQFRLAKTNGDSFVVAEPCELSPQTAAELMIIVDGTTDSTRITLPDGIARGQRLVRYEEALPF